MCRLVILYTVALFMAFPFAAGVVTRGKKQDESAAATRRQHGACVKLEQDAKRDERVRLRETRRAQLVGNKEFFDRDFQATLNGLEKLQGNAFIVSAKEMIKILLGGATAGNQSRSKISAAQIAVVIRFCYSKMVELGMKSKASGIITELLRTALVLAGDPIHNLGSALDEFLGIADGRDEVDPVVCLDFVYIARFIAHTKNIQPDSAEGVCLKAVEMRARRFACCPWSILIVE